VRAILVHPTSTNIMWCGGVDGGVWKTTNSGASWFPLDDFMPSLAVSCMAMDPANPNVLYAGTGEAGPSDGIRGAGIVKTTDGGNTWAQLSSTANESFQYVNRLAIDPDNSQLLLAATVDGIHRSIDGGVSWVWTFQHLSMAMLCIAFNPADSSKAIASDGSGQAWYSTNGGVNWTAAAGIGSNAGRVEVVYSRSNPATVFASVDRNSGEVYRSTDGGHTYSLRGTPGHLRSQGWYDNTVWVDPTNPNIVIVGGIDLYRSTDAGTTFTNIGGESGSIHPDQHVVVNNPLFNGSTVRSIFVGSDGGVFRAVDAYTASSSSGWQELNNNLGITQFYGGAGNSNTTVIVGGTQDNGTLRYTTGGGTEGWTQFIGGDGGFCAADNTDPNYFYGEGIYLVILRSTDGGVSADYIFSGITDVFSNANFIAPFVLDPNNNNTMLAGGSRLWRSTNVKAATPSWSAIKSSIGSYISAIAVAPGNSAVIWVGHNNGEVYSTANGTAASPTWTLRGAGTLPGGYCTRIAIDPLRSSRAYVTFGGFNSGNVWRTSDGGVTWSDISANLPAAPVNSIVVAPANTNTLYIGSEVGVFGTSNGGGSWSTGNDGPANVAVEELFWLGNKLVAVTHGRGMFYITPTGGLPTVSVTVPDGAASEPGSNTGTIKLTRTGSTVSSLVVNYTRSGSASNGIDYVALPGPKTIPAGTNATTITITPVDDSIPENTETVTLTLASGAYNIGSPSSGTVNIADNDFAGPTVTVKATDATASEPGSNVGKFTFKRTLPTNVVLNVFYTVSGTATPGSDYTALSGSITIAKGKFSKVVTVKPIDNQVHEPAETVIATLRSTNTYTVGSPNSATITINDND
jgi:photosystem II stability/assembly factor-like uncharacterized protein